MTFKKQAKFKKTCQKILAILLFLSLFVFAEPYLRNKAIFALSPFEYTKPSNPSIKPDYPIEKSSHSTSQQKSRAPEPSSLFLILSGLGGMIVRFAQKSFQKFKRASDIFLSILGIFITSPLLILSAILIKLSSKGHVLYKQKRVGKNAEIFEIYKLRTMVIDAEKETGAVWAMKDDPRITPIGRILRKAHIDEIPQLINVIKGEMSIIGPRPERPEMVRDFKNLILDYEKRLQIKPGITGIAQAWYKYDETLKDVKKKLKYDLLYVKRMCWLVDLRILAQTFIVVLTGRGAR